LAATKASLLSKYAGIAQEAANIISLIYFSSPIADKFIFSLKSFNFLPILRKIKS
jgi:hypothetical protein